MYITLELTKKHLNIDLDYTLDDEYLLHLIDVVEDVVSVHIDNNLKNLLDSNGYLPAGLQQAMLLLLGHFYNSREAVAYTNTSKIPLAFEYLLDKYQNYNNADNQ